jgi:hypothetical protein
MYFFFNWTGVSSSQYFNISTTKRFLHTSKHNNSSDSNKNNQDNNSSTSIGVPYLDSLHEPVGHPPAEGGRRSEHILALYKDRNVPAIPFDKNLILASCLNFTNKIFKDKFLNEWGTKAGIYLIDLRAPAAEGWPEPSYKHDPKVVLRPNLSMVGYRNSKKIFNMHINTQLIRLYTSKVVQCEASIQNVIINPGFLTGFVDGEGSFLITIRSNKKLKVGWNVELRFQIGLHKKDKDLLYPTRGCLGVGKVYKDRAHLKFSILSIKDLQVVIEHFDKYPLITRSRACAGSPSAEGGRGQKLADYILFKQAYNIILNKEHLTFKGLNQLVSIKGCQNMGLSPILQFAFSDSINTKRPLVSKDAQNMPNPHWLAGFTNGEGCFLIIRKSSTIKLGTRIVLRFQLTQHSRDVKLLQSFEEYFKCGKYYPVSQKEAGHFVVKKLSDIVACAEKIIPFFRQYELIGQKRQDFLAFCRAAELIKTKKHLTSFARL